MARTTERLCISLPIELSNELRGAYPHVEFSSLIVQLLTYAHTAGFMKRLNEIDPADYDTAKQKKAAKANKKEVEKAIDTLVSSDATIEEFGS